MALPTEYPQAAHDVRRRPSQQRSRERFDKVIAAASVLIAQRGLQPVTMTDIAVEAGMSVTAVYRYFPNKQAVVRELALRTFETATQMSSSFNENDHNLSVEERIVRNVTSYCLAHLKTPVWTQIRAAIHADAELAALDIEDSRRNATAVADELRRSGTNIDRDVLERRALVLIELMVGTIRLASQVGESEAEAIIAEAADSAVHLLLHPTDHARVRIKD